MQYGGDTQTAAVYVNGEEKPESYVLCDRDILGFDKGSSSEAVQAPLPLRAHREHKRLRIYRQRSREILYP